MKKIIAGLLILVAGCCLSGCGPRVGRTEHREERDPMLRRARARRESQDISGAIEMYNRALERNPRLTRAHLELGQLFENEIGDYPRAIYHYQRYLDLRPAAEKSDLVEDMIRRTRLAYVASLPERPPGAVEEIARLRHENQVLREQLNELLAERSDRPPAPSPAPPPAAPARAPETPAATASSYRVRAGDSLHSIAQRLYGDTARWRDLFEANRDALRSPDSLREGQVLVVPP